MRGAVAALSLALAFAGAAEARGQRIGGHGRAAAPYSHIGARHRAGAGEIRELKPLGPSEFRPYKPAKPIKPFSYLDHERRGGKGD